MEAVKCDCEFPKIKRKHIFFTFCDVTLCYSPVTMLSNLLGLVEPSSSCTVTVKPP